MLIFSLTCRNWTFATNNLCMGLLKDNRIDVIVNCAAYTAVDKAEDNQELCDKLNHVAPGYLAAAAELAVLH